MRAAAKLDRVRTAAIGGLAHRQYSDFIAVLLAEQREGAGLDRLFGRRDLDAGGNVGADLRVDLVFDGFELGRGDRGAVGEVKPQAVGLDQRALLRDMFAEHLAQRGMHQVGRRVVRHDLAAADTVNLHLRLCAELDRPGDELAHVDMHIAGAFLDIAHDEAGAAFEDDLAVIARLAAGFGVEGRGVEDEFGRAGRERGREGAAGRDGDELAFAGGGSVACELRAAALAAHFKPYFIRGLITGGEAGGAAGFALRLEGGFETGNIHFEAAAAQDVLRQVQREAERVGQAEGDIAGQRSAGLQFVHGLVEEGETIAERALEAGLFLLDGGFDCDTCAAEFRIGLAHLGDQRRDQLVHQRLARAEHVAMAHGAAHDAAQDITAAFIRRQDAVGHEEGRGAQVVGDDAEGGGLVAGGLLAIDVFFGIDQCTEEINVIVVVLALQDSGDPLKAHAGIDRGLGQARAAAAFVLLELHEDEVPDFDEPVAILIGAAGRAAGDLVAMVEEDFRARAAGAGVAHRPEIVGVRNADDARIVKAGDLFPDRGGLFVFAVDRDQQALGVEAVILGDQLPGEPDGVILEIVAEGEIPQHFEEGVVAGGVADIVEVIVLAAGPHAFLRGGRAGGERHFGAGEDVLERDHARIDEQQRRIVLRHQGRRGTAHVAVLLEEAEEGFPDLVYALHVSLLVLAIMDDVCACHRRGARRITEAI